MEFYGIKGEIIFQNVKILQLFTANSDPLNSLTTKEFFQGLLHIIYGKIPWNRWCHIRFLCSFFVLNLIQLEIINVTIKQLKFQKDCQTDLRPT